jgi:hypothetical protein
MDALEQFLGGEQATKSVAPSTAPKGKLTKEAMFGVNDLAQYVKQAETTLPDLVPGSATHTRTLNDLTQAKKALAQFQNVSVSPTAAPTAMPTSAPAQAAAPAASDPLEAFLSGQAPAAQAAAQPAPQAAQPSTTGTTEATMGGYVPRQPMGEPRAQLGKPSVVGSLVGKYLQAKRDVGEKTIGAIQNLGERAAGAIDTLYEVLPATYGAVQQAIVRPFTTPQKAEELGKQAGQFIAPSQPLGKIFGITGKETYQQPLGGITQPIAEQVNKMFNVLGMTPEQISEKTGIPASDIRGMVTIGSVAVPRAIKELAPGVKQIGQAIAKPIKEAAAELQVVKPLSKAEAQAQFEARQAPEGSAGAAATANNPFVGQITGEEKVRGQFPQVKLTKIPENVPVSEQQLRSQLFQEVLPDLKPRPGVVTGNDNLLRNEHGLANMAEPSPVGMKLKQQIANEQIGFSKYAEDRVNATGASTRLINDEQRGTTINDVFHGQSPMDETPTSMMGYLNQGKKQVYDSAFEKMGSNKIETTHLDKFVNDPLEISTFKAAGQGQLLEGAKELIDLARTTGFKMRDGTILEPGSVASYDHVRKIFNSPKIWNRDRASFIRDINGAIDQDIAAVADPALYKLGDNIHKLEKTIFGSKGIKTLFGEMDANGIVTSSTPLEKIPTKLNNLPKDQWRHVRDTLSELSQGRVRNAPEGMPPVPQELRQAATAAVAEIDGALAREVYKAGASKIGEWNSNSVNNVLNSTVGEKILETFPPSEVQKYHALNYVGQFTPGLKYEGAGQQTRRIGLLEKGLPGAGAGAGAALGAYFGEGPAAVAGGTYIGREVGAKLQARKAAREESKAVKKMEKEMQKAAELGKQTGTNKLQDLGK